MARSVIAVGLIGGLLLTGCGERTATLPADPVEQAASCGVIAAASERGATGAKGDLPAEAQQRIFHYPLLAGSSGADFDNAKADAVFKRMPGMFDSVIKGKWQTLKPACATAFPATQQSAPALPEAPLDSLEQCYALVDFMRKALNGLGGTYGEAAMRYGVFADKLDPKLSAALARAGVKGDETRREHRAKALSAAAKLGQPPAVIAACQKKYG